MKSPLFTQHLQGQSGHALCCTWYCTEEWLAFASVVGPYVYPFADVPESLQQIDNPVTNQEDGLPCRIWRYPDQGSVPKSTAFRRESIACSHWVRWFEVNIKWEAAQSSAGGKPRRFLVLPER